MKKILSLLIALSLVVGIVFGFTACEMPESDNSAGNGENIGNNGNSNNNDVDNGNNGNTGNNCDDSVNTGNGGNDTSGQGCADGVHTDADSNDYCDECGAYVIVVIDLYALNDLHGKFCDNDIQPGVDELASFLNNKKETEDNVIILSSGDMWQGSAESNLSNGLLITEWMNLMGFASMTLGNHEFDWGEEAIEKNAEIAEFPLLAINIYDVKTGQPVNYCQPSVIVDLGDVQVGIIGAIGDCYSSISSDMVSGIVEFKVGNELNRLVQNEAALLRSQGADIIVYSVHDGESSLPNGVADIVFEGHSHSSYVTRDAYGTYHLQGGGENQGISHAELTYNSASRCIVVSEANIISSSVYSQGEDDPATEMLEDKYADIIDKAYEELGISSQNLSSDTLADLVSELYLKVGLERWGDSYDIVLGGGFISPRSPYSIGSGVVTYGDILPIFPFNNRIALCKVSGSKLLSQFLETTNTRYHITCSEYGDSIKGSISAYGTYYVIVDNYTALYEPNGLTVVDYYDDGIYARDLIAEEIKKGRFYIDHSNYTLTSIKEALNIGNSLAADEQTTESYYIRGTVQSIYEDYYGNIYITDGKGNTIYVYGLYDLDGTIYGNMSDKPQVGDTITIYGPILNFRGYKVEIISGVLIDIS